MDPDPPVGENPTPRLQTADEGPRKLRGFPLGSGVVSSIWLGRDAFGIERSTRLRRSGYVIHHGRRSLNLCWFPECFPVQIVDHLASKIIIRQVCRRGERLSEQRIESDCIAFDWHRLGE